MRPLLRRPRFEEKNKEEKEIQHNFLDCPAKKKPNASDVPALPPAALHTLHILWLKGLSYVEGRGF